LIDTIERRWGLKIKARGLYRDPVRSSRDHFVRASGLRWLSLMVMVPIPWAKVPSATADGKPPEGGRRWALPFLTVLAPSERWSSERGRRHKTVVDWARQAVLQARRWLPGRRLVVVADAGFSGVNLIAALRRHACLVTRLRIDASLFAPAPPRRPGQMGRPRLKGRRLPTFKAVLADPKTMWSRTTVAEWYGGQPRELEVASDTAVWYHSGLPPAPIRWVLVRDPSGEGEPQAFLSTDLAATPERILGWFVSRWRMERRSRKPAPIWAWKLNGNGPISPSCARRQRCSACFPWSRCGPTNWPAPRSVRSVPEPLRGMTSASRPSATPSPRSDAPSGARTRPLAPAGFIHVPPEHGDR